MKKLNCLITLILLSGLVSSAWGQDMVWTGAAGDLLWKTPGNWTPAGPPDNTTGYLQIASLAYGSPVQIDPGYNATHGPSGASDIWGPEQGQDLWINGGTLTSQGNFIGVLSTLEDNRSILTIENSGEYEASLSINNLCVGDKWWATDIPMPYATMYLYSGTVTVGDYIWLGGHIYLYGGTLDVTNGFNIAVYTEDDLARLDIWAGQLIVPDSWGGMSVTDRINDEWIPLGWLYAYGYTPGGPEGAEIKIDLTTQPGRAIVTAVAPADRPTLIYPVDVENIYRDEVRLEWEPPAGFDPNGYRIFMDPNEAEVALGIDGNVEFRVLYDADPNYPSDDPTEYITPALEEAGTRYYWMVQAEQLYPGPPEEEPNWLSSTIQSFTTMPTTPVIITHPISQTVAAGTPVTLSINALNVTTYRWYHNGNLVGDNSPTYNIGSMAMGDEGYYYCNVSNPVTLQGIDSNIAMLMTQRLVAAWDFEETIDPNYGDFTCEYLDPNENDGSPSVPVFDKTDPSPAGGYAIKFSGDTVTSEGDNFGEGILVEPNDLFNFYPRGFTASAWVQTNGPENWITIVSKTEREVTEPLGWALLQYPELTVGVSVRETIGLWGDIVGTSNISLVNPDLGNTWHLVTGSYDGTVSRIYVDGTLENTSDISTVVMQTNTFPLVIGAETNEGYGPWDGLIDNVEIYSYALSDLEIARLYTDLVPDAVICIDYITDDDMDFNDDCIVDIKDLAEFASSWLECFAVPTCIE